MLVKSIDDQTNCNGELSKIDQEVSQRPTNFLYFNASYRRPAMTDASTYGRRLANRKGVTVDLQTVMFVEMQSSVCVIFGTTLGD
jgi:hypothetical protein